LRKPCWSDFSLRLFRGRFVFREAKGMENGIDRSLVAAATGGEWRRWGEGDRSLVAAATGGRWRRWGKGTAA
jgi:hypothetical protein